MLRQISFAWLLLASVTASSFAGTVIYDNAAGGAAGVNGATLSDDRSPLYVADDVTLGMAATVTGVEWTGVFQFGDNVPPLVDQFTVAIYGDAAGEPAAGAPLATFPVGNNVQRTDSGIDFNGSDIYEFSADINFMMNAGTTYWLSIYNDTEPDDDLYYWSMLHAQGNSYLSGDGGASWSALGNRHDFRLLAVPEPEPKALVGILFASFLRFRRNKRCLSN